MIVFVALLALAGAKRTLQYLPEWLEPAVQVSGVGSIMSTLSTNLQSGAIFSWFGLGLLLSIKEHLSCPVSTWHCPRAHKERDFPDWCGRPWLVCTKPWPQPHPAYLRWTRVPALRWALSPTWLSLSSMLGYEPLVTSFSWILVIFRPIIYKLIFAIFVETCLQFSSSDWYDWLYIRDCLALIGCLCLATVESCKGH